MRKKEKARLELDGPRVGKYLKWLGSDCGDWGWARQGVGQVAHLNSLSAFPQKTLAPKIILKYFPYLPIREMNINLGEQ